MDIYIYRDIHGYNVYIYIYMYIYNHIYTPNSHDTPDEWHQKNICCFLQHVTVAF